LQIWFAAVHDADILYREFREELQQEIAAGKMLQPFMRVMNFGRYINPGPEKSSCSPIFHTPSLVPGSICMVRIKGISCQINTKIAFSIKADDQ
jgi:hypothetical protein